MYQRRGSTRLKSTTQAMGDRFALRLPCLAPGDARLPRSARRDRGTLGTRPELRRRPIDFSHEVTNVILSPVDRGFLPEHLLVQRCHPTAGSISFRTTSTHR